VSRNTHSLQSIFSFISLLFSLSLISVANAQSSNPLGRLGICISMHRKHPARPDRHEPRGVSFAFWRDQSESSTTPFSLISTVMPSLTSLRNPSPSPSTVGMLLGVHTEARIAPAAASESIGLENSRAPGLQLMTAELYSDRLRQTERHADRALAVKLGVVLVGADVLALLAALIGREGVEACVRNERLELGRSGHDDAPLILLFHPLAPPVIWSRISASE